ncbi:MAG: PhoH family protein [Deltaproteobacteria bacterium]|nr:PhoH family protein [Deltaproteobacteria bacterium]MDZ4224786.1 PhoH family protein [bacterium]
MKYKESAQKIIHLKFDDNRIARDLFGSGDQHLKSLEKSLGVDIHVRGTDLKIEGSPTDVQLGEKVLNELYQMIKKGYPIMGSDIEQAIRTLTRNSKTNLESVFLDSIFIPARKKAITPRSIGQKEYIESIRKNDLVFGIGPAGTGKTYLAVAVAVAALMKKQYRRLILARPAVEAGERLGFLPGTMQEKVDPYLRPLYDALYDMLDVEQVDRMIENDEIEIAPLAFMRGRTLHNSFVILDEAQNCTTMQMKMCLTRLGLDSKMVVTGDITQIDLPNGQESGILDAMRVLEGIEGINIHYLTEADVVRHPIVKRVIKAYEKTDH